MATATWVQRFRLAGKALSGLYTNDTAGEALKLLSGLFPGAVGAPPKRGVGQTLDAYSTMPWLRAVSDKVSQSVASVEWKLYVARKRGQRATRNSALQRAGYQVRSKAIKAQLDGEDVEEIVDHPMITLLDDANAYMTGLAFRKLTQIYLDLVGEAFWLKERNGLRAPVGLWPIPPNWILSTPTPDERQFRVSFKGWQGSIPDTEILWLSNPNPSNPYDRGSGVGQALADDLETDQYAARYTRAFFLNNAKPDFLVWPDEGHSKLEEVKRLEDDWANQHQGFWRSFKPHFLNRKVGVYEFSQGDLRAMQMTELRNTERDIILQTFAGFPPELLGIISNSNRATIDAAAYLFDRFTIIPRLEFLRATMQERMIPEFDERLILDYVSPVADDKEFQLKAAQSAPYTLTVDEWRTLQGQDPLDGEGGKVHMVPIALTPTTEFTPPPPPVAPVTPTPPTQPSPETPEPPPPPEPKASGWSVKVLQEDAALFKAAGDTESASLILRDLIGNIDDLPGLSQIAARLEPGLRRLFLQAIASANGEINLEELAQAIQAGSMTQVEIAAKLDVLQARLGDMLPTLRQGFLAGATYAFHGLSDAGIQMSFDLINPYAVTWANTVGSSKITVISEETRDAIRAIVSRSFTEGIDAYKTAREIKTLNGFGLNEPQMTALENFRLTLEADGTLTDAMIDKRVARYGEALLRQRSQMVARTEMMGASNEGQATLWNEAKKQGLLPEARTRRVVIVAPDDRLCTEICEPLDGTEWRLDEPIQTSKGPKQNAPFHPNCRCTTGLKFVREPSVTEAIREGVTKLGEKIVSALTQPVTIEREIVRDQDKLMTKTVETRRMSGGN